MTLSQSWILPRSPLSGVVVAVLALGCGGAVDDSGGPGGIATGSGGFAAGGTGGLVATGGAGQGGSAPSTGGTVATGGSQSGGQTSGGTSVATGGTETGGTSGGGATGGTSVAGSGGAPAGTPGCGTMAETGLYTGTVTAFGLERTYYMSVPDSYDPTEPQRLVFGYHGSNYDGQRMRQYLDLEKPPLVDGTVFVYPDGIGLEDQPDHIAWELGEDERDLAFFDALLEKLENEYCIDPSRIFVNGQSFGGLMTNAVGCFRGDVVRAIAVVAGSGPRGTCQGQVAAWLTHGMDDDSVSFSSGEASRDHWIEANHCSDVSNPSDPPQCLAYEGCDAGYPVIWCPHVNDGGHQHPSFGREAVREFLASF